MNAVTLHKFKKKAFHLMESRMLKTGVVLEVRKWEQSTIIEIDLHLPSTCMDNWNEVHYMKCKVDDFTFRDYTPSGWDAETSTCTLYIDATHQGAGSRWAQHLSAGDKISYIGTSTTRQSPTNTSAVVCLGDESSIGHLLALQQLTMPLTRFSGALVMGNEQQCEQFNEYYRSPLQPIMRTDVYGHHTLAQWLVEQAYHIQDTIFYLVGNHTMVAQLRKLLKQQGYHSKQINIKGFWS